jgi:hypothetical protein
VAVEICQETEAVEKELGQVATTDIMCTTCSAAFARTSQSSFSSRNAQETLVQVLLVKVVEGRFE